MDIFFSSAQSVYFNQFFCLLGIETFSDFGPHQIIRWKIRSIDAEPAGHVHKLDMRLQSLRGNVFFSYCCVRACQALSQLGVNWPITLCENKGGVHFFTLNFDCQSRYNKLLCSSENGDIARCNKNNSEWDFSVFLRKEQKLVSF